MFIILRAFMDVFMRLFYIALYYFITVLHYVKRFAPYKNHFDWLIDYVPISSKQINNVFSEQV